MAGKAQDVRGRVRKRHDKKDDQIMQWGGAAPLGMLCGLHCKLCVTASHGGQAASAAKSAAGNACGLIEPQLARTMLCDRGGPKPPLPSRQPIMGQRQRDRSLLRRRQ